MAKITIDSTTEHVALDGFDGRYATVGEHTIGFEHYSKDEDPAPLFVGLPGDACQARHWGVVLEGTVVFRYPDGSEDVVRAGEAYDVPPGHLPRFTAGTRVVEFSRTDELAATMAVVMANLDAVQAG
jgi:hypothetical protein